eukprot:CAMPEP_0174718856 /NCGR_PEP_ID=MMETSP1094-20130205/30172_1 /TAXON_ID=156173 /ORGANISM="Chrysochromulina brevifilum, Strain UTEX LB 985" /LENGTH=215 /DNA_ID=CAMNT_0015919059 /DNA_START=108 /DNA_END=755 /DNA_ORIENTATION=-
MAERSNWPALDDGMPEDQINRLADAVFATIDTNEDGELSDTELREYLKDGFAYEDELVTKLFTGIDFDSSGMISAEELRTSFVKHPPLRTAPGLGGLFKSSWPAMDDGMPLKDINEMADWVFGQIDVNDDGQISDSELREFLKGGYCNLLEVDNDDECISYEEELIAKIMKGIDFDTSGEISKGEMRIAFFRNPTLRTAPGMGRLYRETMAGIAK